MREHILQPWWKGSALTSTHAGTNPATMMERLSNPGWGFLVTDQVPPFSQRMETTLIFDQVGTHPSVTSEWPCTHIWSCENTSHSHIKMALHLYLTMGETHPKTMSKKICIYIWSCGNTSLSHIRMALHLHLIMWEYIPQSHQNGSTLLSYHGRNTSNNHVKKAHGLITSLWREPRYGEHQASPWSTQTSL